MNTPVENQEEPTMVLLHGTSSIHVENIMSNGFHSRSYFTTSEEIAEYYSEVATEDHQDEGFDCEPVILVVQVPVSSIIADTNAFDEPLMTFMTVTNSESEWHDFIRSGEIPYPKNEDDVWSCFEFTKSVRVRVSIRPEQIITYDQFNDI